MSFFHKFSNCHNKPETSCASAVSRRVLRLEPLEDRELLSSDGLAGAATPVIILETPTELAPCDVSVAIDDERFVEDEPVGAPSVVDACYDDMANELCDSFEECELDAMSVVFCEVGEKEIDEYDSSPLYSLGLGEDDEVYEEEPDVVEEEASGGEASGGSGSSGGTNSGGSSSGGTSGGSGGTSGGSGGSGEHSHVNHAPYYATYSSGFSPSSSGGSVYTMKLTSDQELVLMIEAMDYDESAFNVDENLTLGTSGVTILSQSREKSGSTYTFTIGVDISNYGRIHGSFWVEDCHGLRSEVIELNYDLVRIDGFEFQEKAPGESDFHALVDSHVLWQENENRLHFLTTPQVNYNNATELAEFENLFSYRIDYWRREWTGVDYTPSDFGWESYAGCGVYDVKVELFKKGGYTNQIAEYEHDQYYCYNAITDVEWVTPESYATTNSYLEILSDSNNGKKAYVEQSLNTSTGVLGAEKNVATVNVTVACNFPNGLQGTVSLQWFDPDNPIGSTKTTTNNKAGERDNHGCIASTTPVTLTFNQNTGTSQRGVFTIARVIENEGNIEYVSAGYAGDNYVVAAHPNVSVFSIAEIESNVNNSGGSVSSDVVVPVSSSGGNVSGGVGSGGTTSFSLDKTSVLTIWRTLWAEKDTMTFTFPNGFVNQAPPVLVDGLVASELARACISIGNYSPNSDSTTLGDEFANVYQLKASRNSPFSTDSFWTVLVTSAFRSINDVPTPSGYSEEDTLGVYYHEKNGEHKGVGIFNWTISSLIDDWNTDHPDQLLGVDDLNKLTREVTLHEIGHALGLEDEETTTVMIGETLEDMYQYMHDDQYRTFSIAQLREIQSHSKPQNPPTPQT